MRLLVVFADRPGCYVALHSSDTSLLFSSLGVSRHFCRPLRLDRTEARDKAAGRLFVGWVGDAALKQGTLEVARPFAACLGLEEGESVTASAVTDAAVAASVMVQPHSADDWEVVELQASFIEENLLAQIAVLTPGMVFTVWIHGQLPVKLRVDPSDSNRAECFLLDRNSELVIESRKRSTTDSGEKPYALFGAAGSKGSRQSGPVVRLRVLTAAPSSTSFDDLDAPIGRVHPEDLQRLVGCAPPDRCLVWVATRAKLQGAASPPGGGEEPASGHARGGRPAPAVSSGPRLLTVEASAKALRGHLLIGAQQAEHSRLPCFSLVRMWRCRQVPVYVPHVELVPLGPWHPGGRTLGELNEEDSSWLVRLFRDFVSHCGEVDLMDGAVVQLRDASDARAATASGPAAEAGGGPPMCNGISKEGPRAVSSSSEVTDLYDGLSDIDEIYRPSPAIEVISTASGIFEIDLGLDDQELLSAAWPTGPAPGGEPCAGPPPPLEMRPGSVSVSIRFALGGAREDLRNADTPPFIHLSPSALVTGLQVTAGLPGAATPAARPGQEPAAAATPPAVAAPDPLELLWQAVPGIPSSAQEGWHEVVRLVVPEEATTPLDGLKLFDEPAGALRQHVLAQLGCAAPEPAGEARPGPLEGHTPEALVPGATAVVGMMGTGKTTLCRRVLADLRAEGVLPLEVSCTKLGQPTRKFKAVQDWFCAILRVACWYSPTVVLLDDLGALCPDVEPGSMSLSITEERSVFLAELLLDLLPGVRASGARVALIATLPDQSSIHRILWCYPAMEHKVSLRPPHLKERPGILQTLCKHQAAANFFVDESLAKEGALDEWGGHVDGYSVADLSRLVERATIEATIEATSGLFRSEGRWSDQTHLGLRHLERACQDFVPATLGDQSFFTSSVRLSDIGGLEDAKHALLDMLTMPTKYAVLVDRAPVRGRRGMMLVGPPGCGKTMLVHAAASETKGLLRFLTVKGPELLSKYIGASEAGVRQVFERAAAAAPSVIFFDEIEALAPRRGGDSTGVTDRVVNQMLCYLDGVEDRGRVFVVAATGRPDLVDAALMRPGRFDKICYCGLPSEEDKLQICEILARKNNLVAGQSAEMRSQLQALVAWLPRLFTCADLNALFSSAKIEAVNEALSGEPEKAAKRAPTMAMSHLYMALATAKASISEADERRYAKIFAAYQPSRQSSALRRDGSEQQPAGVKVALA